MRFLSANALSVPLAMRVWAAYGLARWLLVLLLVFDQVGAPWHAHRHDSGVDGAGVSAVVSAVGGPVHADADGAGSAFEPHAETEAHAPDERPSWAHATTVLRIESGLSLAAAADAADAAPAPSWPDANPAPRAANAFTRVLARRMEPSRPVHRSLPPAPQAPPRRA